jgi:hypothetical protein
MLNPSDALFGDLFNRAAAGLVARPSRCRFFEVLAMARQVKTMARSGCSAPARRRGGAHAGLALGLVAATVLAAAGTAEAGKRGKNKSKNDGVQRASQSQWRSNASNDRQRTAERRAQRQAERAARQARQQARQAERRTERAQRAQQQAARDAARTRQARQAREAQDAQQARQQARQAERGTERAQRAQQQAARDAARTRQARQAQDAQQARQQRSSSGVQRLRGVQRPNSASFNQWRRAGSADAAAREARRDQHTSRNNRDAQRARRGFEKGYDKGFDRGYRRGSTAHHGSRFWRSGSAHRPYLHRGWRYLDRHRRSRDCDTNDRRSGVRIIIGDVYDDFRHRAHYGWRSGHHRSGFGNWWYRPRHKGFSRGGFSRGYDCTDGRFGDRWYKHMGFGTNLFFDFDLDDHHRRRHGLTTCDVLHGYSLNPASHTVYESYTRYTPTVRSSYHYGYSTGGVYRSAYTSRYTTVSPPVDLLPGPTPYTTQPRAAGATASSEYEAFQREMRDRQRAQDGRDRVAGEPPTWAERDDDRAFGFDASTDVLSPAWRSLAAGDDALAIRRFAELAQAPDAAAMDRVGFALASAARGSVRSAAITLRRVLERQPEAIGFLPSDPALEARLAVLSQELTRTGEQLASDEAFFVAAVVEYLLLDEQAAADRLFRAERLGFEGPAAERLWELVGGR